MIRLVRRRLLMVLLLLTSLVVKSAPVVRQDIAMYINNRWDREMIIVVRRGLPAPPIKIIVVHHVCSTHGVNVVVSRRESADMRSASVNNSVRA